MTDDMHPTLRQLGDDMARIFSPPRSAQKAAMRPIPCSEQMPPEREYVLMWETPSLRWSVGSWMPKYQQWSNRDDCEYAIHPHQVSHWMPLPSLPE